MTINWPMGVEGGPAKPVYLIGGEAAPGSGAGAPVTDTWRVQLKTDAGADDSDKIFTVPAGQEWQVLSCFVSYVSTAAAGDRQLALQILDALGNIIYEARAGAVQAAAVTRRYQFSPGLEAMSSFLDTDLLTIPIGAVFLGPLWQVKVYDNNAVAAAADDMTVQLTVAARGI